MREVVVTRKYQVTIPKEVREELGIKVGDRLLVSVRG
ncbi:MAG: AbrB/MazE/SpoVT family DNA-binding domain-containing protein, partial [Thermoprotei archaeon]